MMNPIWNWGFLALVIVFRCHSGESDARHFRDDFGIAREDSHLPADLNSPDVVRWRIPLDSGHSSPIAAGERIALTTYRDEDRQLATVLIDSRDGRILWRRGITPARIEEYHRTSGNPATPTPAFDGERIFSFFGSVGLLCHDLQGKLLWEHRMGPFPDEYGAGSSPILFKDLVILNQDHDSDNFLVALDQKTGKVRWKSPRPDAVRSYSTPVLWQNGNRTELLVAGSLELAAYDPATGERRWWQNGLARIVIPMPVPVGDTIFMASWAPGGDSGKRITLPSWKEALEKWDSSGDGKLTRAEVQDREVLDRFFRMDLDQDQALVLSEWDRHAEVFRRAQNSVMALRPPADSRGELKPSSLLWKHTRGIPYVSSPVVLNGRFWMVKDGGIVTQLDTSTGQPQFEERLPGAGAYFASPVAGDQKLYFASESGIVTAVANTVRWNVLSSRNLAEKIYATPAIHRGKLLVRTEKALYSFAIPPSTP